MRKLNPRLLALSLASIAFASASLCGAEPTTQPAPAAAPRPIHLGNSGLRSGQPLGFTPDSKGIFTHDANAVYLSDAATGKRIRSFNAASQFLSFAQSADGTTIATSFANHLQVFDVATGKQIASPGMNGVSVNNPALSADGKRIAWMTPHGIAIHEVATGKEIAAFNIDEKDGHPFIVRFSPDGATLAAGGSGVEINGNDFKGFSTLGIWDIAGKRLKLWRRFDNGGTPYLAFSPDSKRLVSGGVVLHLWDVATTEELSTTVPDGSNYSILTYAPDGKSLVCLATVPAFPNASAAAVRFDVTDAGLKQSSTSPLTRATNLMSDDGRFIAFGTTGTNIIDTATGKPFGIDAGATAVTRSAAFVGDGSNVVTVSEDGFANVWETATGKFLKKVDLNMSRVMNAAISLDGSTVVATDDMQIFGIDMATGNQLHASRPMVGRRVTLAALSPDGKRVAAAGRLFDMQMHWGLYVWSSHGGGIPRVERSVPSVFVTGICWSPDGGVVALGSIDGSVHLFESETGTEKKIPLQLPGAPPPNPNPGRGFRTTDRSISSIDISPNGRSLAATFYNGDVALWDMGTGQMTRLLPKVGKSFPRLRFDPRGFALAVMDNNGDMSFFEVATGLKIAGLSFGRTVPCWNFSPDGQWIVTGGEPADNTVWKSPLAGESARPAIANVGGNQRYEMLWADIGGPDAAHAFQAASDLAGGGPAAANFIADQLKWPAPSDEQRAKVKALIGELSVDEFATRINAEEKLAKMGGPVRPLLIEALKHPDSIDARITLERVLNAAPPASEATAEETRVLRTIAALEQVGGPDALKVLEKIWNSSTDSKAAAEARFAMANIRHRSKQTESR